MTEMGTELRIAKFELAVARATRADQAWEALQTLSGAVAGFKLFTVMTVDMVLGLARRAYTSHPAEYPVSGTKPINQDAWFDIVHGQHRLFVANSIGDIARVFPDHQKIWSMGCGSVVNLPVIVAGDLAATVNMLHEENYYTPERVALIEKYLTLPARRAYLTAASLS